VTSKDITGASAWGIPVYWICLAIDLASSESRPFFYRSIKGIPQTEILVASPNPHMHLTPQSPPMLLNPHPVVSLVSSSPRVLTRLVPFGRRFLYHPREGIAGTGGGGIGFGPCGGRRSHGGATQGQPNVRARNA
jgi:hypothetical protein